MKLYHGTTLENAEYIEETQFEGSFLQDVTDGLSTTGSSYKGFVFCSDDIDEARGYGDAIFEIEVDKAQNFTFKNSEMTGAQEYAIPVNLVNYRYGFERVE